MSLIRMFVAAGMFLLPAVSICPAIAAEEPNTPPAASAGEPNSMTELQAAIAVQKAAIAKLTEELDAMARENTRLRGLCKQAGIAVDTVMEENKAAALDIVYLGKPRTQEWLAVMHKRFADRLVKINGRYVCVNAQDIKPLKNAAYEAGTAVQPGSCRIIEVLGPDGVLATQSLPAGGVRSIPREPVVTFHLKGVGTGLVDNETLDISTYMVSVGTYEYTVGRTTRTIPDFVIARALTRQEFTEALAAGAKLVEYKVIGGKTEARPIK